MLFSHFAMRLKSIEASRRENGMSCLDTQKVQVLSQMHIHFHSMNSVRTLSTQHHVKNCYFLRIEHFRTLTCNKCIVCCAKHNELFKLARHPNPATTLGKFSLFITHTNTNTQPNGIRCSFVLFFFCIYLRIIESRTTRMTAR